MSEFEKGPQKQRRGRGARERILAAAQKLFRAQGINNTGMDQLCAVAQVSKRTAYQHFASKDELIAEYLRRQDPETIPQVFDRDDLSPREQLLEVFAASKGPGRKPTPLCPYIDAAVELSDPKHPARKLAGDYKRAVAARLTTAARAAGAEDPERLGEQLALLLDGASVRTRTLGSETLPTAVSIAEILIDQAIPAKPAGRRRASRAAA